MKLNVAGLKTTVGLPTVTYDALTISTVSVPALTVNWKLDVEAAKSAVEETPVVNMTSHRAVVILSLRRSENFFIKT